MCDIDKIGFRASEEKDISFITTKRIPKKVKVIFTKDISFITTKRIPKKVKVIFTKDISFITTKRIPKKVKVIFTYVKKESDSKNG